MYGRQAAASRLLLWHPEAEACAIFLRAAPRLGMTAHRVRDLAEALEAAQTHGPFGVVVIAAGGDPGVADDEAFVTEVRAFMRSAGHAQFVIVTERSLGIDACCDLVQTGVGAFLDARSRPPDEAAILDTLVRAREAFRQSVNAVNPVHADAPPDTGALVWRSPAMAELLTRAARAAQVSDVPILIYGESGTGKQLLAEYIHSLDRKRNARRFLSVNCTAITGTLAESTLFGHVKGAFTGATGPRKGIFRAADGGTVLLDEVGEMDLALQPKLLRVLQEGVVMPLGADEETACDVRVIAATNRRLAALVEERRFRLDLYQRLNVITLEIPPLRERPEDIPALVRFFLKKYASYYVHPLETVEPEVDDFLQHCALEGNVRELENAIRQALAFKTDGTTLALRDIPPAVLARARQHRAADKPVVLRQLADVACQLVDSGAFTLPQLVNVCEELVLRNTLRKSGETTSADLARQLGMSRRTLYNKISKYGLLDPGRPGNIKP